MIITIDGPAGSGKSTTAKAVARRMGLHHVESGAFYRALTHAAMRAGIPTERWSELTVDELEALGVRAEARDTGYRFFQDSEDITDRLRTPEVNANVSLMARVPAVRHWLLDQLRGAARGTDLVTDGRDMGTVVFPDADLKVFLTASPEVRARRRLAQDGTPDPDPDELRAEVERLKERDRIDTEREVAPLRKAEDAVLVDTSDLSFDEQVRRIVELAESRRRA